MIQRIWTLTRYFSHRFLFSLNGIIYAVLALAFWFLFFDPRQDSPDFDHYFFILSGFGAGITFLVTLTLAGQVNRSEHFPFLVRLPSRVEYLTAVFFASLWVSVLLQGLTAVLALYNGPDFTVGQWAQLFPVWISLDIFAVTIALHASDFITDKWSRVYFYGIIAVLLSINGTENAPYAWLSQKSISFSQTLSSNGMGSVSGSINKFAAWMNSSAGDALHKFTTLIFWPFTAIANGIAAHHFTPKQALAPAILLLYAIAFYLLATDLWANKDVEFIDG